MAANGPTLLLNPHSGAFVLGMVLWAIGSGGRGVVIVLESAWMVIALGCWSSRTRVRSIACFSSRGWVWARRSAVSTAKVSEDTLTRTRPGELIHAAFELTGFVDRGYQTADLKASGVIGISMRHLDSSTWLLDAASR